MRVLYVNQTAQVSGAERSLLDLIDTLGGVVDSVVACPDGELAEALRESGVPRLPISGTQASFRLHPVHTSRGIGEIGLSSIQVRRHAARLRPSLVHANTTRASLLALLTRRRRPPVLAHVRDWAPGGRLSRIVLGTVARRADQVVANSSYVAGQFDGLPLRRPVRVVHNPVDLCRFDPDAVDGAPLRRALGIGPAATVFAVIAQLTPWKGQDDAIRAFAELRPAECDGVLLLAGSAKFSGPGTQYDNAAFERELRALAAELGVADRVHLLGERSDVPALLAATDVLLLPSWREAFGRIAIEAMAMAVPVVVTSVGGPAEVVRDRIDGLVLAPREPSLWARELRTLAAAPELRAAMGSDARERARTFSSQVHAERVLGLYRELAG